MNTTRFFLTGVCLVASRLALAHPGHGVEGHGGGTLHPLFGSEHTLLLAAIGVGALLLRRRMGGGDRHDGE